MSVLDKLVVLILVFYGGRSEDTYNIDLQPHLVQLQGMRFPGGGYMSENRQNARDYIKKTFELYNLTTEFQNFTSRVYRNSAVSKVNGWNIIAESRSSNAAAPVLLIGTYYDNTLQWNPLIETGASVASMLEISRILQEQFSEESEQPLTIIFAALDLNTRKYEPYVEGSIPGSQFLIEKWLSRALQERKFLGAVILDSIASFNDSENSQEVQDDIMTHYACADELIMNLGYRGNFLAMFNTPNMKLASVFKEEFEKDENGNSFKAVDICQQSEVQDELYPNLRPLMHLSDMVEGRTDRLADHDSDYQLSDVWQGRRKRFVETTTISLINAIINFDPSYIENPVSHAVTPITDEVLNPPDSTTGPSSASGLQFSLPVLVLVVLLPLLQ